MRFKKKSWVVVAAAVAAAGVVFLTAGVALGGRPGFTIDQNGIHGAKSSSEENFRLKKTRLDKFQNIRLNVDDADVQVILSDDYYIEYYLEGDKNIKEPLLEVKDQTLTLKEEHSDFVLSYFNFDFFSRLGSDEKNYYVKLYVPRNTKFQSVSLSTDSGDMKLDDVDADTLKLRADYGDITAKSLTAQNAKLYLDSGDLTAESLKATKLTMENSYGNIKLTKLNTQDTDVTADNGKIEIQTASVGTLNLTDDYGDVTIGELKGDRANLEMDSGDLLLGNCDLKELEGKNAYGDITVELKGKLEDYDLSLETDYGKMSVEGASKIHGDSDEYYYENHAGKGKSVQMYCDSGDIAVTFQNNQE